MPQDGTVSSNYIHWTHSNVLDAAEKAEIYNIEPKVGEEEIELIKEHGTREEYSWVLSYMELQKLQKTESEEIRRVARNLWDTVIENPNRLVQDEVRIVRRMGIEYSRMPYTIRYYTRTKRVSVAWTAVPDGILESVKLMILAPSNDVVKREKMRDILRERPEDVKRAKEYFAKKGIQFAEWWKE
ncbi:MAG: hypothetical protein KGY80_00875 [Candidatus Thorarchaeota archaeon]|nr:hypothetical protein [Candidatus Thorarchaeota archaeon]